MIRARRRIKSLSLSGVFALATLSAYGQSTPSRQGMLPETWASGVKQGFGTAYGYSSSKTWFTLAQGTLSEAYWPQLDLPQIRDSQFLVTGPSGLFWEERTNSLSEVKWLESGVPAFFVRSSDSLGRFSIEKWIWTEVSRNAVRMRVRFTPHQSGLRLFVLHNPTAGGTPMSNSGVVTGSALAPGDGLFAWDGPFAQAWISTLAIKKASAAFSGPQDLFQDLQTDGEMNWAFSEALDGNVVLGAELSILKDRPTEFEVVLSFGPSIHEAYMTGLSLLRSNWQHSLERYSLGWRAYQSSIRDLSAQSLDGGERFRASVAMLKAMEDKLHPGAVIAAPSIPWGFYQKDESRRGDPRSKRTGGYHLIWPRDLYMMATTWMAIEDYESARAAFFRLKETQHDSSDGEWTFGFRRRSKDGSFAQNMWIDGEIYWPSLQLDETAFPVILAYRLWKASKLDLSEIGDMAIRASDFIADFGPWSAQERWEESFGASPSTIASQIAALYCGAELARASGDLSRAHRYQDIADAWSMRPGDNLEAWTFTRSGGVGDGHYFVRVEGASRWDQIWNPNDDELFWIANGGPQLREKDVLDGGFLELVRLGVRSPLASSIQDTLGEYDSNLKVIIPGRGMGYYRYTQDQYGYDERTGQKTRGMLWPLLTGERGHYALAVAREASNSYSTAASIVDQSVIPYIQAMENFATPSLMMPEQVWDSGPEAGLPTGAATPLGWTHAEYIKLLRSREMGDVFDRVPLVFERTRQLWRKTY